MQTIYLTVHALLYYPQTIAHSSHSQYKQLHDYLANLPKTRYDQ